MTNQRPNPQKASLVQFSPVQGRWQTWRSRRQCLQNTYVAKGSFRTALAYQYLCAMVHEQSHRQAGRQTDTHREMDGQTDRHTRTHTHTPSHTLCTKPEIPTASHININTYIHTETQTDRLIRGWSTLH